MLKRAPATLAEVTARRLHPVGTGRRDRHQLSPLAGHIRHDRLAGQRERRVDPATLCIWRGRPFPFAAHRLDDEGKRRTRRGHFT